MADCCSDGKIIRSGNQSMFRVTLKQNKTPVTDLTSATKIIFALISVDTQEIVLSVEGFGTSNPDMVIDSPTVGTIQVTQDSIAMTLPAGFYHVSVGVQYSPTNQIEWVIKDAVQILEDYIS